MELSPWWETMIAKYGSHAAVLKEMHKRSALGGSTKTTRPKGFAAMTPERRSEISRMGGRSGRRTK